MKKIIFVFFLFSTLTSFSQNYVIDSNTKEPISSVNIFFNKNMGVITNDDGYFELPENVILDTIHFSHLSYKFRTILKDDLKKKDTVFLDVNPIELDEVVLNNINPKNLILKSIEKIDDNYLSQYNSFGFYRQTLLEDGLGIEMIEVDFMGYVNKKDVSVELNTARRTQNFSALGIETYGGVSAMIQNGDFVRNKDYFLNSDKVDEYEFSYGGKINYNNSDVFRIDFTPMDNTNNEVLRNGFLYIDSESMAIVEIRYTFDTNKLARLASISESNISNKKPMYRLKEVENVIKYKQLPNKKWSLSYIDAYNLRQGIFKNESFDYVLKAKLVINNIETENLVRLSTNYNLTKDFNKSVRKLDNVDSWDDTYKLSLSEEEKRVLSDIENKQKKY